MSQAREKGASGANQPQVLVRTLPTPPGLPWDQKQVAVLEAKRTSPSANLRVAVQRLGRWAPRKSGTFAALYVRESQVGKGLTVRKKVDGQLLTYRFLPERSAAGRLETGIGSFAMSAGIVVFLIAGYVAVQSRSGRSEALDRAERRAAIVAERSKMLAQIELASGELARRSDVGLPPTVVLSQLKVVAEHRDLAVPVEAIYWRPEAVGAEVRGEASPFIGATAERSSKPVRTGVWLWAFGAAEPVSAAPKE